MKLICRVAAAVLMSTSFVLSQPGAPPEELAKFDVMLGSWKGGGTAKMAPGGPDTPWTAVSSVRKILGGHAIQEDFIIDLGEQVPAPLRFRTIYTWDAHAKTFKYFGIGNTGFDGAGQVYWTKDGKLVMGGGITDEHGAVVTEQWVVEFSKDKNKMKSTGTRSSNGGPFFAHVKGTYTKSKKKEKRLDSLDETAMAPPSPEMKKLSRLLGKWKMTGKVSPMPGVDAFPISSVETIESVLGGHVLQGVVKGDPFGGFRYEGNFYFAWDQDEKCFVSYSVENMGGSSLSKAFVVDGKLVFVSSSVYNGVPTATRAILEFNQDGSVFEIIGHRAAGTAKPDIAFEGRYEKAAKKVEKKPTKL